MTLNPVSAGLPSCQDELTILIEYSHQFKPKISVSYEKLKLKYKLSETPLPKNYLFLLVVKEKGFGAKEGLCYFIFLCSGSWLNLYPVV